ncbi:DedA family protein [Paenibacillus sp. Leaf72]|uniref:DedA family protein n=1 Tax=Paenibacillus sp. Leaf72 TaxID=1736234 RepID=UPI0006FEDE43|nr:DedA family protein [Paenibacillus sp. Leaf72]KQN99935.1 hypothetical protein ASF12_17290 [Paenibacillus sp. Leaf72]
MISETFMHLIDQYGYFIFLVAFSLGPFGIPIPNEISILTGAFLSSNGTLNPWVTYLVILLGLLIAVTVSYFMGKVFGKHFKEKIEKNRYFQKAQTILQRHGNWAMVIGFFLPVVRYIMPMLVGLGNVKFRTFILISYSSALLWTATFFVIGRFFIIPLL